MAGRFQVGRLVVMTMVALAATGCAADRQEAAGSGAPVILPGAPGSPGRTAAPGERPASADEPVAADVRFAEGMIPHHRQALEMAGLAAGRTTTRAVRAVAERISLTQPSELRRLTEWLAALDRPAPAAHAHGSAAGPAYGMATEAQLSALRAARGQAFDWLFLRLMIRHHEGAMRMAGEELSAGGDRRLLLMARDVYTDQGVEVARMRAMT